MLKTAGKPKLQKAFSWFREKAFSFTSGACYDLMDEA